MPTAHATAHAADIAVSTAVVFRKASLRDLDTLLKIEEESFDYYRLKKSNFTHFIKKGVCDLVMAFDGYGEPAGYALNLYRKGRSSARLYSIAVLSKYRGCGIGVMMLNEMERIARRRGLLSIYLELKSSLPGLLRFYEKRGYKRCRVIADYYGPDENALQLCKSF